MSSLSEPSSFISAMTALKVSRNSSIGLAHAHADAAADQDRVAR